MAVGERDSLTHEAIEMRRVHVRVAERADRVESLLVGDNENDIGSLFRH